MPVKHGVNAKSDPNFTPDPNTEHVYDEKKGVWRLVTKKKKRGKSLEAKRAKVLES